MSECCDSCCKSKRWLRIPTHDVVMSHSDARTTQGREGEGEGVGVRQIFCEHLFIIYNKNNIMNLSFITKSRERREGGGDRRPLEAIGWH